MKKLKIMLLVLLIPLAGWAKPKKYTVLSPDKKTEIILLAGDNLQIAIKHNGHYLMQPSDISMQLSGDVLGKTCVIVKVSRKVINEVLHPVIKVKDAEIINRANELTVVFKGNYYVVLRAYDNGVAYRFGTTLGGEITVVSENANFSFPENDAVWWGEDRFQSAHQVYYKYTSLENLTSGNMASLPVLMQNSEGVKIGITETDLLDYPGLYLKATGKNVLHAIEPQVPKKIGQRSDRYLPILSRENYIAKTKGTRTFPWRIFMIADQDANLLTNELPYILASPSQIKDPSWIKPGKVAWDWWNANNIYDVGFRAGINTQTYKYYIDFAAKYGIQNILLDEGWYKLGDLTAVVPDINMEEITAYAHKKHVGVYVWCVWKTLEDQMEQAFNEFDKWGLAGIKVDFMNRDDQKMVNFYYKTAQMAAKHHLAIDFHGAYKPAGLRRIFPNILTREGVNGAEQYKWSLHQTPRHDVTLPFVRMLAGPMDYTPGAMNNAQKENFRPVFNRPMSMGTRCHQLAMYVCFESPLQMLCDAPTNYMKDPKVMDFLSIVPTVWDQTLVLQAKVGGYVLMARRNGDNWYVGGMTNWQPHDFDLNLSFLPAGRKYEMTLFKDGINADRIAIDYKEVKQTVDRNFKTKIHLAPGGGLAIILKPVR
jgi:alpha-glucosidase